MVLSGCMHGPHAGSPVPAFSVEWLGRSGDRLKCINESIVHSSPFTGCSLKTSSHFPLSEPHRLANFNLQITWHLWKVKWDFDSPIIKVDDKWRLWSRLLLEKLMCTGARRHSTYPVTIKPDNTGHLTWIWLTGSLSDRFKSYTPVSLLCILTCTRASVPLTFLLLQKSTTSSVAKFSPTTTFRVWPNGFRLFNLASDPLHNWRKCQRRCSTSGLIVNLFLANILNLSCFQPRSTAYSRPICG